MDSELSQEDKNWINQNLKPKERKTMENIIESPASATMTIKTPNGFSMLYTMRELSDESLLERITLQEAYFVANGYTPDTKYPPKKEKVIEYVEGRSCPKCGAKLVYFESKGLKHIKCSTQKWDFNTKKTTGCDFVEWADAPVKQTQQTTQTSGALLATPAQQNLIQDKWPDLWKEGLTKVEASQIIKNNYSK